MLNTNILSLKAKSEDSYGKKFWLMMGAFYALFIIRNIINLQFPVPLYLAWVIVMALSFDDNEIKALVLSFSPLSPGFQFKYAIFICVAVLIVRNYKQLKANHAFLVGVMLMAWEFLHFGIGSPSFTEFIRGFAELIFIMIIMCIPTKRKGNIEQLTRALAISSTVAFIILLFMTVEGRGETIMELLRRGFRFGVSEKTEETFTFNYNANALGFMCNIAIAGLFINIHNKTAKIIDYLMLAFCIFIGLLTVSRTFLICLLISVVAYVLLQQKSLGKKIAVIAGLLAAIGVLLLVISNFFPEIIENYTVRFGDEDVTGGRSYLFEFYNKFIFSSPDRLLFGIGIQNIAEKASSIMGEVVQVPHNGYQQLVVAWGIPGFVLMVLFVYQIIKKASRSNPNPLLIGYLPFLILMINILAGQFVTVGSKILALVLIYEILSNPDLGIEEKISE
ncbi:MAG: O-antigen ligase family protein [Clostridia bacterium]|nr:O-antigen ligase family protein [Clostridia bacterium]